METTIISSGATLIPLKSGSYGSPEDKSLSISGGKENFDRNNFAERTPHMTSSRSQNNLSTAFVNTSCQKTL